MELYIFIILDIIIKSLVMTIFSPVLIIIELVNHIWRLNIKKGNKCFYRNLTNDRADCIIVSIENKDYVNIFNGHKYMMVKKSNLKIVSL